MALLLGREADSSDSEDEGQEEGEGGDVNAHEQWFKPLLYMKRWKTIEEVEEHERKVDEIDAFVSILKAKIKKRGEERDEALVEDESAKDVIAACKQREEAKQKRLEGRIKQLTGWCAWRRQKTGRGGM